MPTDPLDWLCDNLSVTEDSPQEPMAWFRENLLPALRTPSAVERLAAVADPALAERVRQYDTFPERFKQALDETELPGMPDALVDPILCRLANEMLKVARGG